jgi:hypothetical protein
MTHPIDSRPVDPLVVDLVDSVVAAIDIDRTAEVYRVRDALRVLDAVGLFDDELRLNGTSSTDHEHPCICEVWL